MKSGLLFLALQMGLATLSSIALAHGRHHDHGHHHHGHHHHQHPYKLVCGTQGTNYQPYDQNNDVFVGKYGFGYAQPEDCYQALYATADSHEPVVCNWNGVNFQPYHIYENHAVGFSGFGYATGADCNYAVRHADRNLICSWNGTGFQLFSVNKNRGIGRASVATLQECIQLIHR